MSAKTPIVSVNMVRNNNGQYLRRGPETLVAQAFSDLKVVLGDKASADVSTEGVSDKDPSLRVRVACLQTKMGFPAADNPGAACPAETRSLSAEPAS